MVKTDNIYMDALRYGVKNISVGVTHDELKEYLTKIGWDVDSTMKDYYSHWFFTHFFHNYIYNNLKNNTSALTSHMQDVVNQAKVAKLPLTSEAFELYQDFEKLKQAKIDTKKAQKTANWAIGISIGVGLAQIILQIIQMATGSDKFCFWCAF